MVLIFENVHHALDSRRPSDIPPPPWPEDRGASHLKAWTCPLMRWLSTSPFICMET